MFDRFHESDIAFLDQVGVRQTVTEKTTGNRDNQTQMRKYELLRGHQVALIAQTHG